MVETKFKQTEIGLIPEDWEVIKLRDYCSLKNGYAFPSINFSNKGPIVMTPGNFKLDGGLKFDENKTIRYKGDYNDKMRFFNGDLVMVMTDLTPDCNLLGKSGIINTTEIILHNQRIGKIVSTKNLLKNYLSAYFNSEVFSNRMKNTATGSTVRHTSTPTILNTILPLPPLPEQQAIAEVLSDTDTWIESLEQLIAKKQLIKQGAMQKLLTPDPSTSSGDWEVKKLGEVCDVIGGGTPSTFNYEFWNGNINWFTPTEVGFKKYLFSSNRKISEVGLKNSSANMLPINSILLTTRAGIGDLGILKIEACTNQGFQTLVCHSNTYYEFIYYLMQTKKNELLNNASGSTFLEISPNKVKSIEIQIPSFSEQTRIATILSDMDLEIEGLEQKLEKAEQIKQGLMKELLTGKIRLVQADENKEEKSEKGHNEYITDAVLIGTMASCFASEQFPLTRFKYTKVSYLLKRYNEEQTTDYLKKAAGPYNPKTRYGGAENIAKKNKYVSVKKSLYKGKAYEGFIIGENVAKAIDFFKKWYGDHSLEWIKQFKFETNDNLELWATVDMAIQDLKQENKAIGLETVKQVIKENKEWRDKLKRPAFSDKNIESAIGKVAILYT